MGIVRRKKNNMEDYLEWRGDLTFEKDPFNEIDGVIFSVMSYINLDCVAGDEALLLPVVTDILMKLPDDVKYDGTNVIKPAINTTVKAALSRRFRDVIVSDFRSETDEVKEIQFAAVTFTLPDDTLFVAFRGTDNSIVGWKEDFNMAFSESVPAQRAAAEYLVEIAEKYNKPMRIGGHSKGGNISIWAAAKLPDEYKHLILDIYNNDGPGFSREFLDSPGYQQIRDRIHSFVPESSVIGVLLEYDEFVTIASSNPSLAQHMPASWLVSGTSFVRAKSRTKSGEQFEKIARNWNAELSQEERKEFIESAYSIIISSNAKKIDDISDNKIKSVLAMQKSYKNMDPEKQKQLVAAIRSMIPLAKPEINENSKIHSIKKIIPKSASNVDPKEIGEKLLSKTVHKITKRNQ